MVAKRRRPVRTTASSSERRGGEAATTGATLGLVVPDGDPSTGTGQASRTRCSVAFVCRDRTMRVAASMTWRPCRPANNSRKDRRNPSMSRQKMSRSSTRRHPRPTRNIASRPFGAWAKIKSQTRATVGGDSAYVYAVVSHSVRNIQAVMPRDIKCADRLGKADSTSRVKASRDSCSDGVASSYREARDATCGLSRAAVRVKAVWTT
mmetsp:Transcript_16192/g.50686  ORF Transcript_16192/g.50686 Transcript_16192/m.50686 type:complete len:207 (+) Transcript_16192:716-1336(+)